MIEQPISFETAKLAKSIEFDIECQFYYRKWYDEIQFRMGSMFSNSTEDDAPPSEFIYLAPTQSLLQKWLREKYKLHVSIADLDLYTWSFTITELCNDGTQGKGGHLGIKNYKSYEEALEAGLRETLKLIKQYETNES